MVLFGVIIRRNSISLLKFHFFFFGHFQVFSSEVSFVCCLKYPYSLLLLFTPLEFFTSVLADGFSLEIVWQQISSSLQDSSQDSGLF